MLAYFRPKNNIQKRTWLQQAQIILRVVGPECLVMAKYKQDWAVISGRSGQLLPSKKLCLASALAGPDFEFTQRTRLVEIYRRFERTPLLSTLR